MDILPVGEGVHYVGDAHESPEDSWKDWNHQ